MAGDETEYINKRIMLVLFYSIHTLKTKNHMASFSLLSLAVLNVLTLAENPIGESFIV